MVSKIVVKKSGIDRKGVFATKDIKKGEVVNVWHPKQIIFEEDMNKLPKDEQNHTTPTGDGKYMVMGIPERYVNHSCDPNTYVKNKKDMALKDIKKGEEITSDYSISGIDDWKMDCLCGSKNCRKIVYGDFFKLPIEMQRKYIPYLEDWFKEKFRDKLKIEEVISLEHKQIVEVTPKSPYNFDANMHKPSHFPSKDNLWEKGNYWITMVWKGKYLGLKFENIGTIKKPKMKIYIYSLEKLSNDFIEDLIKEVKWRFNFEQDVSEFFEKFKEDKILKPIIKKWAGMKPIAANSFYETLIIYFVLQNATVRRSVQMLENLFNKFGKKVKFDNKILFTFWEPNEMSKSTEQELRDLKLGYRAKFFMKLTKQFVNGEINEFELRKLDKNQVREKALELYGIGPASVEYLLFEDFYFVDALSTIPPWEQMIFSQKKKLNDMTENGTLLKEDID